jgi:squalene synthase HpnC
VVIRHAYATCLELARRHYENFPVASRLLPRQLRPHIAAIYAFARIADDIADEGQASDEERLTRLDDWSRRLERAAAGDVDQTGDLETTAVFTALADTICACRLDVGLLANLLRAFRQDVLIKRYDTWESVIDYCSRSANPIGRLVLAVSGYREPRTAEWSDAVCTALQLANFWQDLAVDWRKGRLYVPASIVHAAGAHESDLDRRQITPAWRLAISDVTARTRGLFDTGRPVADAVRGRLRWELRATWLGGVRVLDRLERAQFDVFNARPSLGWRDAPTIAWRALIWRPVNERAEASEPPAPGGDQGAPASGGVGGSAGTKAPGQE